MGKKIVTFLLSSVVFFQLYIPLIKVYKKKGYEVRMVIRKNIEKGYSDPTFKGKADAVKRLVKKHRVMVVDIEKWLQDAGLTFCVDGDTNSKNYMNYIESLIVNLIGALNENKRKRFTIVSLVENTNYVWRYHNYINFVDYVIFPHKDYLNSYVEWHLQNVEDYQEVPEQIPNKIKALRRYLKKIDIIDKYPILENVKNLEPSCKYETKEELEPVLMEQVNSSKNLFLGTPKYDFQFDYKRACKKYDIPKTKKIAIIFHPEYRIRIGIERYGIEFKDFYVNIHEWLRNLGYFVIVKDRLKDTRLKRELIGDLHINNHGLFPNPSIELLQLADIAVFFSSSVIEEVFHTKTAMVDVVIDDIDRAGFLRSDKYCYVVDGELPSEEEFKKNILKIEKDKEKKAHNKYVSNMMQKYYPVEKRPYSENIYNELNKIMNKRIIKQKGKKIKSKKDEPKTDKSKRDKKKSRKKKSRKKK
jgi:hypothetical protein